MDSLDIFEVLVRENSRMLTAYIRAAERDCSVADDIWQETMLTAWRRWDDYDRSRPFAAWLRGIAAKNILAAKRRHARTVNFDEQTLEYFGNVFTRVHQLAGDTFEQKLDALRACIESLPDAYREAIRLRYQDDVMPAALADQLGLKLETVKKQLQRGKAMLFDCVTRKLDHTLHDANGT